ncbi:hypothetical protein AVEN_104586-1 [Araneus ventricosus]|uniref:Zinc finger PHD-type domain-containing protein n=1 Tax=Araneus ventricosus TaxID=182803 RepID=A0A4Y2BE93_ARAVE|nr:hypothetical protein AVEN_104586-1 [Araneus ventricosus]
MSQSVSSTRTRYNNEKNSVDKKINNKENLVLKENLGNFERKRKQKKKTFDSDDDENCLIIYSLNPYEESRSGKQWVQCTECKRWSHEDCITNGNSKYFVCINCESDFENSWDSP